MMYMAAAGLKFGVEDLVYGVRGIMQNNVIPEVSGASYSYLETGWYNAGYSYMEDLANGLASGLYLVEAQLAALAGLFPSSPAEWGPFSKLPTNEWVSGYMDDVVGAMGAGLDMLGGMNTFDGLELAGAGSTETNNITVNLNGATIRNDNDVRLLAQELWREIKRRKVNL